MVVLHFVTLNDNQCSCTNEVITKFYKEEFAPNQYFNYNYSVKH